MNHMVGSACTIVAVESESGVSVIRSCTCAPGFGPGTPVGAAPSTKSAWNSNWLTTTPMVSFIAESLWPASTVQTITDSIQGTATPNHAGIAPPAETCDISAEKVATDAATPPRATRGALD